MEEKETYDFSNDKIKEEYFDIYNPGMFCYRKKCENISSKVFDFFMEICFQKYEKIDLEYIFNNHREGDIRILEKSYYLKNKAYENNLQIIYTIICGIYKKILKQKGYVFFYLFIRNFNDYMLEKVKKESKINYLNQNKIKNKMFELFEKYMS